jgi:membrane fusion protein, multidrug efflux system
MFAEVRAKLPQRENVLTIPERAISYNPYGNSVFVVVTEQGNKTAKRVQVKTGNVTDGRVEVFDGLEAGAEVVTDGHHKLRNDQPLAVDNSSLPDDSGNKQ